MLWMYSKKKCEACKLLSGNVSFKRKKSLPCWTDSQKQKCNCCQPENHNIQNWDLFVRFSLNVAEEAVMCDSLSTLHHTCFLRLQRVAPRSVRTCSHWCSIQMPVARTAKQSQTAAVQTKCESVPRRGITSVCVCDPCGDSPVPRRLHTFSGRVNGLHSVSGRHYRQLIGGRTRCGPLCVTDG